MDTLKETQYLDNPCYYPTKGLSQLCVTILGKPLNKDEQFSDWERRPLRESQLTYAGKTFIENLDYYALFVI